MGGPYRPIILGKGRELLMGRAVGGQPEGASGPKKAVIQIAGLEKKRKNSGARVKSSPKKIRRP